MMPTASSRWRWRTRRVPTPAGITCGVACPGTPWPWNEQTHRSVPERGGTPWRTIAGRRARRRTALLTPCMAQHWPAAPARSMKPNCGNPGGSRDGPAERRPIMLPQPITLARCARGGGGVRWGAACRGQYTSARQGGTHAGRSPATDTPAGTLRVWAHDPPPQPSRGAALTAGAAVQPTLHGHKVWPTSFVLLDYLHQRGVPPQTRVLELGCGWGLVGIACAKMFQAQVTGLDADAAVFPYLQLHAAAQWGPPRHPPGHLCGRSRPRTSRRSI